MDKAILLSLQFWQRRVRGGLERGSGLNILLVCCGFVVALLISFAFEG
jgi:hypothetical protein